MAAARSKSLEPVCWGTFRSTETPKAVWWGAVLSATIIGIESCSNRSRVRPTQSWIPASRAMKLTCSGVTVSAAVMKSPSFSRSSSSTTMIILPAAMSARASSMVAKLIALLSLIRRLEGRFGHALSQEGLHVLGENIDLEVDDVAGRLGVQRRRAERVRDERHTEGTRLLQARHRETHAVHRHRSFLHKIAPECCGSLDPHDDRALLGIEGPDKARPVDVALDDVAPEAAASRDGALEVDRAPGTQGAEGGPGQGLLRQLGGEGDLVAQVGKLHDGQADAVDGDRVPDAEVAEPAGDLEPQARCGRDPAYLLHDAGKHLGAPAAAAFREVRRKSRISARKTPHFAGRLHRAPSAGRASRRRSSPIRRAPCRTSGRASPIVAADQPSRTPGAAPPPRSLGAT